MKHLTLTACLLCFSLAAFSNEYVFKVLANKGQNTIKNAEKNDDWAMLKTGSTLQNGQAIRVQKGAYVALVHSSGITLELKEEGQFTVKALAEKLENKSTSVAGKYADFLLGKINNEGDGTITDNHRQNLYVTGAVERSLENFAITASIPGNGEILNQDAIIRWTKIKDNTTYIISFKNMFNEVLAVKETTDNYLPVHLNEEALREEKVILFSIAVKNDQNLKSDSYALKRISEGDALKINEELQLLKAEIKDSSSLNDILLASFYEHNNLLIDAIAKYEEAIENNPEIEAYQVAYNSLKTKYGLSY